MVSEPFAKAKIRFAAFIVNTLCTLKCKYCITRTPYQRNSQNYPVENIKRDIDGTFEIFEHMDHLDFEGGEPLLHHGMPELVLYAFAHMRMGHCDEVRILTNCTVVPNKELLDACKHGKFLFLLDDYGEKLSVNKDKIIALLEKYGIPYRVDVYTGTNQYFDGWIDFGDFNYKNSTPKELQRRVANCRSAQQMPDVKDGKVFLCGPQMSGMDGITAKRGEYIDLSDNSMSLEEKIQIGAAFGTKPIEHCKYCNGFITDGKRIAAAEQLETIMEDIRNCG